MAGPGWRRRGGPAERLDPVRRPGRATLLRRATVALLVAVAGALAWSGPSPCAPAPGLSARPAPNGSGAASPAPRLSARPAPDGSRAASPDAAAGSVVPGSVSTGPPGPSGPAPPGDRVGVPLRLAEPAALVLVRPGSRVDVLRVEESGRTTEVASAALVLGVTDPDDPVAAGLLVALTPVEAERAVSRPGRGFAVLVRPG